MGRNLMTKAGWIFAAVGLACAAAGSMGAPINRTMFYTRWNTNTLTEANVKKTVATYDPATGVFSCTPGVDIARTNGADGLVIAPKLLNTTLELAPGTYVVDVNKTQRKVTVEAGKKTVLWAGELVVEGKPATMAWYAMQGKWSAGRTSPKKC